MEDLRRRNSNVVLQTAMFFSSFSCQSWWIFNISFVTVFEDMCCEQSTFRMWIPANYHIFFPTPISREKERKSKKKKTIFYFKVDLIYTRVYLKKNNDKRKKR